MKVLPLMYQFMENQSHRYHFLKGYVPYGSDHTGGSENTSFTVYHIIYTLSYIYLFISFIMKKKDPVGETWKNLLLPQKYLNNNSKSQKNNPQNTFLNNTCCSTDICSTQFQENSNKKKTTEFLEARCLQDSRLDSSW